MQLTDYEVTALLLSLKIAGVSILISLPIAIFMAWILARYHFIGKSVINSILHLPLVLPPVVIGYLLLITLGRKGFIGAWLYDNFGISFSFSWQGAVVAISVVSFPLIVRAIRLSFEQSDVQLEQAAHTLGASRLRSFLTISLPLAMPGIMTGVVLGFARALGEFGATITFVSNIPGQTSTIPLAMYQFIQTPGEEFAAMRLCIISILIAFISLFASEYFAKKMDLTRK